MKEEDAYRWFMRARWPSTKGVPCCPACGVIGASPIRRRRFRCPAAQCRKEFSVTSGTILASRKLSFRTLVMAIALSVHSVKGKAACQLKRELGVDYKTAFVLLHKLREALAAERRGMRLEGVVEVDAMHVGGHVKPENVAEERIDRRIAENRNGKRMAVMTLRQRGGPTFSAAVPGERGDVATHLVRNHVEKGAELRADQHPAYDDLVALNPLKRNDHSIAFVDPDDPDASTNQAESHFSRLRRAEIGIHHRISGKYLDRYAADVAWRESKSRTDFRSQARMVLASALGTPISRDMKGYWQNRGKAEVRLVGWNPLSQLKTHEKRHSFD